MEFESRLIKGRLVERYKRFMADIVLDNNQRITAHCPNTGAMRGLSAPGLEVWVSRAKNKKRKLSYTLELVNDGTGLVGVNTHSANKIVYEAINNNKIGIKTIILIVNKLFLISILDNLNNSLSISI